MGKMKEVFMEIEDYEREAEKDKLYLLALILEAEAEAPGKLEDEAKIIVEPKKDKNEPSTPEHNYTLPF